MNQSNTQTSLTTVVMQHAEVVNPRVYNLRPCPKCGETLYGMPGGRDAHCVCCGYKDPCCGD